MATGKQLSAVLYAPEQYWRLPETVRLTVVNGCGPGGWLRFLVPDTNWGLNITPVCDIHDYMYTIGQNHDDKVAADRVMLNNHIRWIDANTKWDWLRRLRYNRAAFYYEKVRDFGGPAFWRDKNKPSELGFITCTA